MALREETIQELMQIIKEDYGREITKSEALKIATSMIGYFDLLAKIRHREEVENNYENHNTIKKVNG